MLPIYQTPGVYFERSRQVETPTARRTDIAGFAGMAERGPLHTPLRLTNWREYQQAFGNFLPYSHLAYCVRAFFENGGQVCWVVRTADEPATRAASVGIPDNADGVASFAYFARAASPGAWGDGLAVSVQAASLASTQTAPIPGLPPNRLAVASTGGLSVGSYVLLQQRAGENVLRETRQVEEVDVIRGLVRLDQPPTGFNPLNEENPITLKSQEFTLLVFEKDQVVERFANLALDERHSRFSLTLVNEGSQLIRLERGSGRLLPFLPWRGQMAGGLNGLSSMTIFDQIGTPDGKLYGLAALAGVEEVSLLALPDLVASPAQPAPRPRQMRRKIDPCATGGRYERTILNGRVLDSETGSHLQGVSVSDGLTTVITDAKGRFSLADQISGPVELVLSLEGYTEKSVPVSVQVTSTGTQDLGDLLISPLELPPTLTHDDIYYGQAEMVRQCEDLRNRFALIDPPLSLTGKMFDLSELVSWRSRFDSAFAALYYPWLVVLDPAARGEVRAVPPSGHVAGAIAATDLAFGVFQPPANRRLNFVDDVSVKLDNNNQGILNPRGINVIRAFPGQGMRIWGARTVSSESAWRFVNVRRLMTMLEITLQQHLQWAVFEPNDATLQLGLVTSITTLLDGLWRQGALVGDAPEAAYRVRCDATTTPPDAVANGQIIAVVQVAPMVPYEFVVLRLGVTRDEIQISEI